MSRLTAQSGHRTALSLVFVKKQRNLDQLDLVNKSLLCSDDNSIGVQRFNNLILRKLDFWILIGANDMSCNFVKLYCKGFKPMFSYIIKFSSLSKRIRILIDKTSFHIWGSSQHSLESNLEILITQRIQDWVESRIKISTPKHCIHCSLINLLQKDIPRFAGSEISAGYVVRETRMLNLSPSGWIPTVSEYCFISLAGEISGEKLVWRP